VKKNGFEISEIPGFSSGMIFLLDTDQHECSAFQFILLKVFQGDCLVVPEIKENCLRRIRFSQIFCRLPSVAKALEGILRPLRCTPLIFASKKNLRIARLACHP
jgi:hypothetical protein